MSAGDYYALTNSDTLGVGAGQMYEKMNTTQSSGWTEAITPMLSTDYMEHMKAEQDQMGERMGYVFVGGNLMLQHPNPPTLTSNSIPSGLKTLQLIKKSVRQIKADAVSEDAKKRVNEKITRLQRLGIKAQAVVLQAELALRIRLARVMEWNYKVLPMDELKKFELANGVSATRDGLKVHVDPLRDYVGNTTIEVEKKDMVIPDFVLDKLGEATDRQVFDDYAVLWVEKVKDPLLLGCVKGCKDYFLIAEWGDDVKFDEIMRGKK